MKNFKTGIYTLAIFTGIIIMMYGLKRLDSTVHDVARISAGLILIASHGLCVFFLFLKNKQAGINDELEADRLKSKIATDETERRQILKKQKEDDELDSMRERTKVKGEALKIAQELCGHKFPYSHTDCSCEWCGVRHSKVNKDVKKDNS